MISFKVYEQSFNTKLKTGSIGLAISIFLTHKSKDITCIKMILNLKMIKSKSFVTFVIVYQVLV